MTAEAKYDPDLEEVIIPDVPPPPLSDDQPTDENIAEERLAFNLRR